MGNILTLQPSTEPWKKNQWSEECYYVKYLPKWFKYICNNYSFKYVIKYLSQTFTE